MKKIFILASTLFFLVFSLQAQTAAEAKEKFQKKIDGNAVSITIKGQKKNVEDVLKAKFKKQKTKNDKGNVMIEAAILPEISTNTMDYYYRVDKVSDEESKIVFFMSKGYTNFLTSAEDPNEIAAAKTMLESMVKEVSIFEFQIAIDAQMKVIEKAEKDQEKLVKDGEGLVKDQEKLEKELEQNKSDQAQNVTDQETQTGVIEAEKVTLQELQDKLNSVK